MSVKALSQRPLPDDDLVALVSRLNRETIPYLRQVTQGTVVTGSRAGATVAILTQLLSVLDAAGIIKDTTTP